MHYQRHPNILITQTVVLKKAAATESVT